VIDQIAVASSLRYLSFARRNYLVWRKMAVATLVTHLTEPFVWLIFIGYGLGSMLPAINGVSYLQFLGAGMLCLSVVNTTSSEAVHGASARWKFRRTWEGILNTPLTGADIVIGEWLWGAAKGVIAAAVMLLVMLPMKIVAFPSGLWALPAALLIGLVFAGLALIVVGLARRDDVLAYYFSLVLMPLTGLSGVFFPIERLPEALQILARVLPLSHAVDLVRGFTTGVPSAHLLQHLFVLSIYAVTSLLAAVAIIKKRLAE
jgi:lipooligosaccharide transport system permease protein